MRSGIGLAASALAGLAAIISSLDGDDDLVPFFVGLTFAGGVLAWATHPPFRDPRMGLARGIAVLWVLTAVAVTVLLVIAANVGSRPTPGPQATYAGLTATVYHVLGVHGGALLAASAAFTPAGLVRQVKWQTGTRLRGDEELEQRSG